MIQNVSWRKTKIFAQEIYKHDPEVKVESVAVQETENNIATYIASDHREYEIKGDK